MKSGTRKENVYKHIYNDYDIVFIIYDTTKIARRQKRFNLVLNLIYYYTTTYHKYEIMCFFLLFFFVFGVNAEMMMMVWL